MAEPRYDFVGYHTFRAFVYNYKTAVECFRRAKEDVTGSHFLYMACLTFCSFTIEAYLNHLGENEIGAWKTEDRINLKEKLKKLEEYNIEFDRSGQLFEHIQVLYGFRDKVAHGRTGTVNYKVKNISSVKEQHEPAEEDFWGISINQASCQKAIKDTEVFIDILHKQTSAEPGSPLSSLGTGGGEKVFQGQTK